MSKRAASFDEYLRSSKYNIWSVIQNNSDSAEEEVTCDFQENDSRETGYANHVFGQIGNYPEVNAQLPGTCYLIHN